MALDITAGQFVLPRGPDASEQTLKASETLLRMKMLKEQRDRALAMQQEQKRNTAGTFLKSYLDPKQYLNGSEYDPVVVQKLHSVMQKASGLAEQGADIPSLLMAIGPDMQDVSQYSAKAKVIDQGIKDNLAKISQEKGYVPGQIEPLAKKLAFHTQDPKTGEFGDLNPDINSVDPSKNYVMEAIKQFPKQTTDAAGINDFIEKVPTKEYSKTIQTSFGGRTKNVSYDAKHPFYMDLARDEKGNIATDKNGNPTGLEVQGDTVTGDDNKPIIDQTTGQPFKALNKQNYQFIMSLHPALADHMRGEIQDAFKQTGQPAPAEGSQAWEIMGRHVLYETLKNNDKSHFKVNDVQRETAPAVKLDLGSSYIDMLRNESRARTEGNLDAKEEAGVGPKVKPLNVAQTTNEIFNNNPDYLKGESTSVDGHRVIDVTGNYQGAEFRFGHGEQEAYNKVYYDPQRRVLTTEDKMGNRTEHKESDMPDFLQKVAGANKLNPSAIPKYLNAGGYSKGKYTKPGDASGTIQDLNKQDADERSKAMDDLFTNGRGSALKGIKTPDGKITEAGEQPFYRSGKYYITVKGTDGQERKKVFGSKSEMENYIKSTVPTQKASQPSPASPVPDAKKKKYDALIDNTP